MHSDVIQKQFSFQKIGSEIIAHIGSLTNEKIILFIGRSNKAKYSIPLQSLMNNFLDNDYTLVWIYDRLPAREEFKNKRKKFFEYYSLHISGKNDISRFFIMHAFKLYFLFNYSRRLDYFFEKFERKENTIDDRILKYRKLVRRLRKKSIIVFSHSSGARIASNLGDEPNVKKMIGFGYPFKHPDMPEELERTSHLQYIKKPFLIFQGRNDEYGGTDVSETYRLSPTISLSFLNCGHNYETLTEEDWIRITAEIKAFMF